MGDPSSAGPPGLAVLAVYDEVLPHVYGYLISRCGDRSLAEELTAETFLGAIAQVAREPATVPSAGWLIGIARHKLADHWRRAEREARGLRAVGGELDPVNDPWDAQLDLMRSRDVLAGLAPQHRAALTLRYLDDLSVLAVAAVLGRTPHATEALLVRARASFRRAYELTEPAAGEPSATGDDEGSQR